MLLSRTALGVYCIFMLIALIMLVCTHPVNAKETIPDFTVAVLSDVHISSAKSTWAQVANQKFDEALSDLETYKPDVVIINGDLTNGDPSDYDCFEQLIKRHTLGVLYVTMGNHEYYRIQRDRNWSDTLAIRLFTTRFHLSHPYHDTYIHGYHFLFLAPEAFTRTWKEYPDAAWLSREQLAWFADRVRMPATGTFVFLHQPLDHTVGVDNTRVQTVQTDILKQIVHTHAPILWFSAHTHVTIQDSSQLVEQDGVLYVGGGSTFSIAEEEKVKHTDASKTYEISYQRSESRLLRVFRDHVEILSRDHQHHRWLRAYERTFLLNG